MSSLPIFESIQSVDRLAAAAAAAAAAICKATAGGRHETTLPITPAMSNYGD